MAYALLAIVLKTSLLMGVAAIASFALARSSAATRHLIWVSALMLALLLPLTSAIVPSYAVMDDPWPVPSQAVVVAQSVSIRSGWFDLFWPGLLAVWGIGALLFLLRDLLRRITLIRFGRGADPVRSAHWTASLQAVKGNRAMRVLETDRVSGPCTWGFFRPVLLLPRAAGLWSEAERRYALTHELAHIARGDYISAQVVRLACAIHWYNPFVWYAARQAHKLQEQACDDAVLRAGAVPTDYAQLLLVIARTCCSSPRTAMGMAERSPLYQRVQAILDPRKMRAAQSRVGALATILPLACAMPLIAGAGLAEPDPQLGREPTATPVRQSSVVHMRPIQPVPSAMRQGESATPAIAASEPVQPLEPVRPVPPIPPVPPRQPVPPIPPLPPSSE